MQAADLFGLNVEGAITLPDLLHISWSAAVVADIQIHIRERLQHDPKLRKWPLPVQLEIEEALISGAHGMLVARPASFRSKC
jgi:hypothetical protein